MDPGSLDNIYGLGGYRWGYRDKARIIAIIDVVSSTLNLGNTFLQFLYVSAYSAWVNSMNPDQTKGWMDMRDRKGVIEDHIPDPKDIMFTHNTLKKLAWVFVLAHFAIHFSQLIFAINLYTGTARTTPAKAHSACRLWFVTSSILLGILGIKIFFHPRDVNVIYSMLEIVFRAVGMYIVGEYAKEIKRDGIGPRPPPVYFSSHAGGTPGSHHHHRRHGSRGLVSATYSLQPPVPVYFSPHLLYESPPKYEEIMRQGATEPSTSEQHTTIDIPDADASSSPAGANDCMVADGLSTETTVVPARLPRYEEIFDQGAVAAPVPEASVSSEANENLRNPSQSPSSTSQSDAEANDINKSTANDEATPSQLPVEESQEPTTKVEQVGKITKD